MIVGFVFNLLFLQLVAIKGNSGLCCCIHCYVSVISVECCPLFLLFCLYFVFEMNSSFSPASKLFLV